MTRVMILCTHSSARSRRAEALACNAARRVGFDLEVHSAGTEATRVKDAAKTVMTEMGLVLNGYTGKTLHDLPDAQRIDSVITVCDSAAEACPVCPAKTTRFLSLRAVVSPVGRKCADQLGTQCEAFVQALGDGLPVPKSYEETASSRARHGVPGHPSLGKAGP
ncbi:MAG: arsenate reductase ArsC [Deinococcota bacterium]